MKTVDTFFPSDEPEKQKSKRNPQSEALQQHNKASSYEQRFTALMNENFRTTCDLEMYVLHRPDCSVLTVLQLRLFDPAHAERGTGVRL